MFSYFDADLKLFSAYLSIAKSYVITNLFSLSGCQVHKIKISIAPRDVKYVSHIRNYD